MAVEASVCVIIAAMNAEATVARAVRSALAQPEVSEVILVDDGSDDWTTNAAREAGDGSGRLRIERLPINRGPSAARNHALGIARAPFVSILDADDMLLPGRFARLFAIPDWDMIADNIVFVREPELGDPDAVAIPPGPGRIRDLDLTALIQGSTSRFATGRTQLGFLKPVIRRDLLERESLRYDESVRLGEDFVLYVQLLLAGARFRLTGAVGYLAVERGNSLSVRHRCEDLAALLAAEEALAARIGRAGEPGRAMAQRLDETRRKWALRDFLQTKATSGLGGALASLRKRPGDWIGVAEGIALDKMRAARARLAPRPLATGPRLLIRD